MPRLEVENGEDTAELVQAAVPLGCSLDQTINALLLDTLAEFFEKIADDLAEERLNATTSDDSPSCL
jgi:hypothetical protein